MRGELLASGVAARVLRENLSLGLQGDAQYRLNAAHTLRTDEELVNVLYAALGTLEYQGQINELEARRLHSLLAAMHRRWINTGCWKPYGAAEEQDEKERRKSQDVNS